MKGIKQQINITSKQGVLNYDASLAKVEKQKGVFVVADGKASEGILADKWSKYLCDKTSVNAINTIDGFKLFIDHIWEEFYEENKSNFKDTFQQNAFDKYGSNSTYTACWLSQENNKTYYEWLSYGNSAVLVYNTKSDELFVPEYKNGLLGFLRNKGLVNWKEDNLENKFLLKGVKTELNEHTKIILATDAMAEHLALSYLIIKSKDDDYWEMLSDLMKSDTQLSDLIYNNRNLYSYNSFNEVLDTWEDESKANNLSDYVTKLQTSNRIAKDDITLQVISYDYNGTEFTTLHTVPVIKTYPTKKVFVKPRIVVPAPKPKKVSEFKVNKEAYIDILLDNSVYKLFHFTDRSNIAMIKKLGGLYSWDYMERNNKNIPLAGGDNLSRMLDARYGLQNFVRTSICKNHPMKYIAVSQGRIDDPVLLEIDPAIVTLKDTLFSDMNATKTGHKKGSLLHDLNRIDFDICTQANHFNLDQSEKPYYQAEVMVKEFIPLKYIMNLNKF